MAELQGEASPPTQKRSSWGRSIAAAKNQGAALLWGGALVRGGGRKAPFPKAVARGEGATVLNRVGHGHWSLGTGESWGSRRRHCAEPLLREPQKSMRAALYPLHSLPQPEMRRSQQPHETPRGDCVTVDLSPPLPSPFSGSHSCVSALPEPQLQWAARVGRSCLPSLKDDLELQLSLVGAQPPWTQGPLAGSSEAWVPQRGRTGLSVILHYLPGFSSAFGTIPN